jgi:Ca2+:H+ antiporter
MSEREHLLPHHSEEEPVTFKSSFVHTVKSSKINVLLIFVPIALAFSNASDSVVFSLNFIAIIPLAKLLGFGKESVLNISNHFINLSFFLATEEIALRCGSVIGSVSSFCLNFSHTLIYLIKKK